MIVYGIANCDTVKKARAWLDAAGHVYAFHNYKTAGADAAKLSAWCKAYGWEKVLNRAGTTFKKLPDTDKTALDEAKAIRLMVANPSMIKRPVVEFKGGVMIGFDAELWSVSLK